MKNHRSDGPGCAKIGNKILVVGGETFLRPNTEIIDVITRTLIQGPKMLQSRSFLRLVTVGEGAGRRVLAIGGFWQEGEWMEKKVHH